MARLAGKVAFITGGGGGIGRATAERFAEEGAKVVIAEIDKERGEAAARSARALAGNSGGDAHFIHCDIRDKANVEAAFAQTIERFGKLTILHNNAGGSTPQDGRVTEAPEEEFWRVINLDLYGTFLCSKIGIPHMIKSGGGSIINMSSIVALRALPGRDCYTAAKGAVAALTRSMAVEYADDKIRVNAIAPGVVLTERVKKLLAGSKDIEKLAATHLRGLGLPIHMADMAVYLASDEAAITTGQILSVDSGATIC
jgi:NAD(P)-dependent dehydrogenase (short-subunit alcohol dehydrogenase family)